MASFRKPAKILLVDDDQTVSDQIRTVLDEDGMPTVVASDGHEALNLIHGGLRPDLVIIDLMMPKLNGWDFCAALDSNAEYAKIPILIMTGGSQIPLKINFVAVAGILRKPFNLHGLPGMVDLAIASSGEHVAEADHESGLEQI